MTDLCRAQPDGDLARLPHPLRDRGNRDAAAAMVVAEQRWLRTKDPLDLELAKR
ncbi:MAG: hypothetical protein U0133_06325 [Gemmatimonadales bacterium]